MESKTDIIKIIHSTLTDEAQAILTLREQSNPYEEVVSLMYQCTGRIVVSGVGKSAIIGKKISATMSSTGTASIFMHAGDAVHGDLGMLKPEDVLLCISKSGDTSEFKVIIPLAHNNGNKVVSIGSSEKSYMALQSDFFLFVPISREADHNDLAPTASTTATLALGDAIAMALAACKGFTTENFARLHPGGNLGKQLYLRVRDIFNSDARPVVSQSANLKEVLIEITSNRQGAVAVMDGNSIVGIITDGDIRRMLQDANTDKAARDIMSKNPKTIDIDELAVDALEKMRRSNITQVLVVSKSQYLGLVHIHDILREGIV